MATLDVGYPGSVMGWGPPRPSQRRASERPFLLEDLDGRLRPALIGSWPEPLPLLDEAVELVTSMWRTEPEASLSHNDVHLSNVLCEIDDDGVRCVGLLDLEAVGGSLPESDLSYLALVHSAEMAGSVGPPSRDDELVHSFCKMLRIDPDTIRSIQGLDWSESESKLDGIAWLEHVVMGRPFVWIEDEHGLGEKERAFLETQGFADASLACNVTTEPESLRTLHRRLVEEGRFGGHELAVRRRSGA